MMSVDIVNLIETNPITKLNGNYQSKLIEKVKTHFTDYEQQMFVASFYCYLNYNKSEFVIDLDNIWGWVGFGQKVNAKRLLEKHFIINKDYKLSLCQPAGQSTHIKGGHNKETFMLTIETFKKYCMKAGTKKADEIHDYFIKLEEILQEIMKEESDELKLQLEEKNVEIESKDKELEMKLKEQQSLEREKVLLNQYATIGSIIYIIKVKTFKTGEYIIKIGQSRKGIMNRYNEHKHKYDECLLLDCFSVNRSHEFENFLHNHEDIRGNRVNNLLNHENELELFLIGKNLSYKSLLKIINNNLTYFDSNDIRKLEKENEQLKLMMQMKNDGNDSPLIHELVNMMKSMSSKIDNLEKLIQEKSSITTTKEEPKMTTGFSQPLATIGPRLQKIHPETLQLVKVYETASECMKEDTKMKRPSLTKAVMENLLYNGFRWLFVDRELDPSIIHKIEPTKQTKTQNLGYIAQINKHQTEIVNVYIDRKTAAHINGYESTSALDNPVKNYTLSKEYYYKLYDDCDDELKSSFEEQYGEPFLYKNGAGQFDAENKLTKEFASKYDCIKQLKMSDKTLTKCYNKDIQYNGYYYKEIGSKLSMK